MNTTELPDAFSTVMGLGALQSFIPAKKSHRIGNLIACFLLVPAAAALFLFGLYDAYQGYVHYGPAMIDDKLLAPGIFALILFGLGALAGWGAYSAWNKALAVYAGGLAYNDRKGLQTWPWQDVAQFYAAVTRHYTNGIYTGTTHVYTLHHRDGKRLTLNDAFKNIDKVAAAIEEKIFPHLYARASELYNSGQAVVFGPVTINKGGILMGKKTFPWSEVQQVSINQGMVAIAKKGGGWFSGTSVMASAIPNLRVLLSIIDQIVGVKAGK
jgi:hypothetical protein